MIIEEKKTERFIEIYHLTNKGNELNRLEDYLYATITFENKIFNKCEFSCAGRNRYTIRDWKFLGEVSKKIIEINNKNKR